MFKKLITCCMLILFVLPLPAMASFADDVAAFEAKYPELYGSIDPAMTAKMEMYLEDVVVYVVNHYDAANDINVQIKNAVASVLLTGETYKNDLMPYLLEQAANQDTYRAQLQEMQAIVRTEALARIAAQSSSGGSSGGGGGGGSSAGSSGGSTGSGSSGGTAGGSTAPVPENPVPNPSVSQFTDLPTSHWASADVSKMVEMGLVKGISTTEFAPERNITRAEFSALLIRALGITPVPN